MREHFSVIHREPRKPYWKYLVRKPADSKAPFKFAYGRSALMYGLQSLGLGDGDTILVPEMTCHSLLNPFDALGILPVFYPVKENLTPDWPRVEELMIQKPSAIIMIHYFGIPQKIEDFQNICSKHGLYLIEDNAHGFGGKVDGGLLGRFGDIGITSPRKTFPIPNGAYLYLKNTPPPDISGLKLEPIHLIYRQIRSSARMFIEKHPGLKRMFVKPDMYISQDAFREPPDLREWKMDHKTHQFLESRDLKSLRKIRQQIYHHWWTWSKKQRLRPVFEEISPECLPMAFPAYCDRHEDWEKWFSWGYDNGIHTFSWPTLPLSVVESEGLAYQYWKKMVCFPINQDMNPDDFSKRLHTLRFDN